MAGAVLAALLLGLVPARAAPLKELRAMASADGANVSIAVAAAFDAPSAFALDGPRRLVVDLSGVSARSLSVAGAGPVARVRAAQFDSHTARIVLDLAAPARIETSAAQGGTLTLHIVPTADTAFAKLVAAGRRRLVMNSSPVRSADRLADAARPKPPLSKPAAAKSPPSKSALARPPPSKPAEPIKITAVDLPIGPPAAANRPQTRVGLPVVVIDAGHGGKDVGTISVTDGRYEKDVVLAIAKAIKTELDKSGRVHAVLTRSDDRFLPLRERFGIARRNHAQLFISIHADSAPGSGARGATVYTLSEQASDSEAARLAAKENRSDIIADVNLGGENSEVSDVLIDLAQRETMNTSAEFAALLQRELSDDVRLRTRFHRFAGFIVLKAPDVPSVLLETGYLSSAEDSKFLFSKEGQRKIARDVRSAVEAHFLRRLAQR